MENCKVLQRLENQSKFLDSASLSFDEVKGLPLAVSQSLSGVFDEDEQVFTNKSHKKFQDLHKVCCTKKGSKKAQQVIAKSRPEEVQKIIDSHKDKIGDLMRDYYANYMCQTLFQSCSSAQRLQVLKALQNKFISIAKDSKGTHSLQTLISLSSLPEEETIYQQAFKGSIVSLSSHPNASHVIQSLLVTLKDKEFIMKELRSYVRELAMDKQGLCVVKKCISDYTVYQELMKAPLTLMQDPYANYAMQLLVDTWSSNCAATMISQMENKVAQLCIQKYSSNVMEKCLKEVRMRYHIIKELITEGKVSLLLNCIYGCYVLRTAASESDSALKVALNEAIKEAAPNLHQKKLKSRWNQILANLIHN